MQEVPSREIGPRDHVQQGFNPSGDLRVTTVKAKAQALAEAIEAECTQGPLKDKAMIDCRSAVMFAVASIFE